MRIPHSTIASIVEEGYTKTTGHTWEIEWYVTTLRGYVIVTFRGTEHDKGGKDRWRDWGRNALAWPRKYKGTQRGHYGYCKAAVRALDSGLLNLLKNGYPGKPIVFAGHSMGVESAVAAELAHAAGLTVVEWVGFGCPKIWTKKKKFPFTATTYRFRKDIVPLWFPWFKHRGEYVQLQPMEGMATWKDHDISLYRDELRKLEKIASGVL